MSLHHPKIQSFVLSIALLTAPSIAVQVAPAIANPTAQVAQRNTSEIDTAIAEGERLFDEGSVELKRKAMGYFEKALELARSAKAQDKQAKSLLAMGLIYDDLGEKQKALDYYHQSLPIFRIVGDRSGEASTLNNVGAVYDSLGEKQKALEYYNQSLPLSRAVGNRSMESNTLSNIGLVYDSLGKKKEALEYYNRALPISHAIGNRSSEATILNNIGLVYDSLGQKQKALEYYNQSLPISRTVGNRSMEATTFNNIGAVYDSLGEKQKALEYYNQSLPISRAVGNRLMEGSTLNNIGNVYDSLGEKQKALEYYNQSLPILHAVGNRSSEASILSNIGLVYDSLSEKQKALEYYNRALPILRAVGNRSLEASTLNNMGLVYHSLGEKQKALEYYNQSLPIFHGVGNRSGEASTLNNIGAVYDSLSEKQKALEYYNQALPILRAVGNRSLEASTLNNMGRVYHSLGESYKALEYYNQALPIFHGVGNRSGESTTLNNIGSVYDSLGEKQKALEYFNQSLPISRSVRNRSGEANTLNNLGFLFKNQKQPEFAIAIYKKSVNTYESIRKDNENLPRELRESYVKTISSTYQALADLLIKQGRLPEAQAVLELLKFKELRDYTREAKTTITGISFTPAEQEALDEVFATYSTAANFGKQLSDCAEQKCPKLAQLEQDRDRVNTSIRAMLDRLQTTLKDQVIDQTKLNTNEFNQAAKAIVNAQPGTMLIYPIVTETKIQFLIAVKAGAGTQAPVTFRAIEGSTINSEDLFKTTNDFRNALRNPNSDLKTLQITSQKLYTILIKPLEPEINQPQIKHLVFATDRATRHIPLAALHDGREYLINKPYSLSTVIAAKGTEPAAPRPTSPNILALGASQFKNENPLNFVEQETNAIVQTPDNPSGIFPGDRYLNSQFSFATLQTKLKDHNILHIATHGILDPANIDNSYLLTSAGEKITKLEITKLQDYGLNNIHMVILSACNTGTGGKNTEGLEIAGISHYFMRDGGAKSVIATLWQVNDPATALFMQQFYQHLKTGMTKAQAIQKVQQDLIQEKLTLKDAETLNRAGGRRYIEGQLPINSLAHPYYWSPFILIGNNQ